MMQYKDAKHLFIMIFLLLLFDIPKHFYIHQFVGILGMTLRIIGRVFGNWELEWYGDF